MDIDIANPYSAPQGNTESTPTVDENLITPKAREILRSAGRWSMFLFIVHLILLVALPFFTLVLVTEGQPMAFNTFVYFVITIFFSCSVFSIRQSL